MRPILVPSALSGTSAFPFQTRVTMLIAQTLSLLLAMAPAPVSAMGSSPALAPTAQEAPPAAAQQDDAHPPESWEAFNALIGLYLNAVGAYQFEVKELYRKRTPRDEWPAHPVGEYFPRFRALADQGNADAAHWLIENVKEAVKAPDERVKLTKHYFTLLANEHASNEIMVKVIQDLTARRKRLGPEFIAATLRTISEKSELFTVDAMALYGEASMLNRSDSGASLEDPERVVEIWQILVDGYAGTKAAKLAAERLFRRAIRELQAAQHVWLDQVTELHRQGIGPDGWPPFPLPEYLGRFEAMASTGHILSVGWVETYYPGCEQALRKGIEHGMLYAGSERLRPFVTGDLQWKDIRFHLLRVLYEIFPDEPWVFDTLTRIRGEANLLPTDQVSPVLRMLIEKTSDERVRYEAMYTLGTLLEHSRKFVENAEALQLYQCVMDQAPAERQRKDGEKAHRELSWTMPGAPLPSFAGLDAEGFEVNSVAYRGRVVMLFFWLFSSPESMEEVPWISELVARYQPGPFTVLGINSDTTTRSMFISRAARHGITWRNVLQQARTGRVSSVFRLHAYPSTFIVDAEGMIRGRNLPHDQAEALIQELLAERAKQTPEKAGTDSGSDGGPR